MRETRLESVLALRDGGLPAPLACWVVARAAERLQDEPRIVTVEDVRVREDGQVRLALADGPPRFDYRAPEVVEAFDGDPRAAVFGLGVLLFETAVGRSPFEGASDLEVRIATAQDPVPSIVGRSAQATRALDEVLQRATEKDELRRYASPTTLKEALDRWLEEELHETDAHDLADAVREAIAAAPSHDRGSLPELEDVPLDVQPEARRSSQPNPARFDDVIVRDNSDLPPLDAPVADPLQIPKAPRAPAGLELDIDEGALNAQRHRQRTLAPTEAPARGLPSWLPKAAAVALVLLALSLVYQFLLRPLLR